MPDCRSCKDNRREPVPYIAHEMAMARAERTVKRLVAVVIVMALLLAGTIAGFLVYLSQYDFTGYSYDQKGDGVNIVGAENEVDYNVAKGHSQETDFEEPLPGEGSGSPQG